MQGLFAVRLRGTASVVYKIIYIPCRDHFVFPGKHMGLTAVEVEGLAGYSAFGEALERSHVGFIIAVCAVSVNDGLEFLPALADEEYILLIDPIPIFDLFYDRIQVTRFGYYGHIIGFAVTFAFGSAAAKIEYIDRYPARGKGLCDEFVIYAVSVITVG